MVRRRPGVRFKGGPVQGLRKVPEVLGWAGAGQV